MRPCSPPRAPESRRSPLAPIAALLAAAAAAAGCADGERPAPAAAAPPAAAEAPARATQDAPARPTPFHRETRTAAAAPEGRWKTARVIRRTRLRATPGGRVIARIGRRTEFGSVRVLGVTGSRGRWLRVVATERRDGRAGWIPASAARIGATDYAIHVDRSARRLVLRRGSRVVARFAVAVGRPGTETPLGRFAVTDKLRPARADSPYGCCAIALSGHQPKLLPGWPGGDRLAIHATPQLETIGTAASLGCVRGRPADLRRLMRRVPLGTPVFIRA